MLAESWKPLADILGFRDEEEMLVHLYYTQGFSLKQMSQIVGYSAWAIRRRLVLYGKPLKPRGGPNNRAGKRLLRYVSSEELQTHSINWIAAKYDVHPSTVYAERKFREKRKRDEVLSNNADISIPSLREALDLAHGSSAVSEQPKVPKVLPGEGGSGGDGDAG